MVSTRRIGRENKSAYGCFGWTLEISLEDRFAITAQGRVDERGRFIINVIRNGEEHLDEPVAYRTRRFSIYQEPRMLLIPLTRRHLGGFECERHSDMKSRQVIARYRIFRVLEHNGKQSLTIFQRSRLKAREKYNACF